MGKRILWRTQAYEKEGKTCIRVEIEYDGETPHFGGPAWIRRGSVTEMASDEIFQRLIEYRLSKVRELAKWINGKVTITPDIGVPDEFYLDRTTQPMRVHPRLGSGSHAAKLLSVNRFWVTFELAERRRSEPLEKVTLSWDDKNDQLQLLIKISKGNFYIGPDFG